MPMAYSTAQASLGSLHTHTASCPVALVWIKWQHSGIGEFSGSMVVWLGIKIIASQSRPAGEVILEELVTGSYWWMEQKGINASLQLIGAEHTVVTEANVYARVNRWAAQRQCRQRREKWESASGRSHRYMTGIQWPKWGNGVSAGRMTLL